MSTTDTIPCLTDGHDWLHLLDGEQVCFHCGERR